MASFQACSIRRGRKGTSRWRILETPLSEVGKEISQVGFVALIWFDNVPVYDPAVPLEHSQLHNSHIQGRPIIYLINTQCCTLPRVREPKQASPLNAMRCPRAKTDIR